MKNQKWVWFFWTGGRIENLVGHLGPGSANKISTRLAEKKIRFQKQCDVPIFLEANLKMNQRKSQISRVSHNQFEVKK